MDSESPRFIIYGRSSSGSRSVALDEAWPSGAALPNASSGKLMVAWRCYGTESAYAAEIEEANIRETQLIEGLMVHFNSSLSKYDDYYWEALIDIWAEADGSDLAQLERSARALEQARKNIESRLNSLLRLDLTVKQEFVSMKMDRRLRGVSLAQLRDEISEAARSGILRTEYLPTAKLEGRRFSFGPEPPGSLDGLRDLLRRELGEPVPRTPGPSFDDACLRLQTLFLAVGLLLTWSMPLTKWTIGAAAGYLIAVGLAPLYFVKDRRWDRLTRRASTIGSIGFAGIWLFGILYALCAMRPDAPLGRVAGLGVPFLLATSMGVAGGVIGHDPEGLARVIAHAQLLLFLGGVAALAAAVIGISHEAGRRER
jgi:hypothetical protein